MAATSYEDDAFYDPAPIPLHPPSFFHHANDDHIGDEKLSPSITLSRDVLERLRERWGALFAGKSQRLADNFVTELSQCEAHNVRKVLRRYSRLASLSRYSEEPDETPARYEPLENLPSLGPTPTPEEEQEALQALQEHTATRTLRTIGKRQKGGWIGWKNNRLGPLPSLPSCQTASGRHRIATIEEAAVEQNVALIRSIPQQFHDRVAQDVYTALADGWPLDELEQKLRHHYGLTRKRATFIARDQNRAITARLNVSQALEAWGDDVEATWWHVAGGETHPRMSHVAAHGTRFRLSEGCCIDGEHIQPGEKIGCKCWFSIHIPGFD